MSSGNTESEEVVQRPGLLYYEFLPLVRRSKMTGQLQFQDMEDVVDRASEWCRQFSGYRLVTLETVQFKFRDRDDAVTAGGDDAAATATPERPPQPTPGDAPPGQYHADGLRVWLFPSETQGPCELGFRDLMPVRREEKGGLVYETIPDLLERFNAQQERGSNPIPGKIINVESRNVNSDDRRGSDDGNVPKDFYGIWGLRIFFCKQEPTREKICVHDVVPRPYDYYTFEELPMVLKRASDWLQRESPVKLYNVQTLYVKARLHAPVGTPLSRKFRSLVRYLKVVRLVYSKFPEVSSEMRSLVAPRALSHKLFVPELRSQGQVTKVGDAINALKEKISFWTANMAGNVLCAESLTVDYQPGRSLDNVNLCIPETINAAYGPNEPKSRVVLYFRIYTDCGSGEPKPVLSGSRSALQPVVAQRERTLPSRRRSPCSVM